MAWLASIGADVAITAKKQTHLPTLTEQDWQRLQPKLGRGAVAAKEAAVQPKEAAPKPKEPAQKPKEPASVPKPKDTAPKPKGRPRWDGISSHETLPDMKTVTAPHAVKEKQE